MKNSISSTEGSKKWQITLAKTFNWCFLIAMVLVIFCGVIFVSGTLKRRSLLRIVMIILVLISIISCTAIIFSTFLFFKKKSDLWNRRVQIINLILISILAFTITYTVEMNYQTYDGRNCIHIAQKLYPTMNWKDIPFGENKPYGQFYALIRCYNMAPLIYLEALVFKFFSLIGIKLSFAGMVALGTYTNTVMLLIALYLAFRLVKKYCKISTQTGFTLLLLINIPLYATVYYVYTDIPALLAVMIILTAYDNLIHANSTKNKILYISIIILTSIIGALFKFNVLIALFAIIIHYFLTHNWKHNIKFILLLLIPTMLGISGAKRGITATSPIPQDELGLPATNWINMSFSKKIDLNTFNEKYFTHTLKLKKQNNNKTNIVAKIEIQELFEDFSKHPCRYLYTLYRKIGPTYGRGTYSFNDQFSSKYINNLHVKNTLLGQLIYGNLSKFLSYFAAIFQLSLFLFMGLGSWQLIKHKINLSIITPWMIALFGNMFMLLFWESRPRYLLPFIGTIYMIACVGIEQVLDARDQKKLKAKNK